MSRVVGNEFFIEPEEEAECEMCGKMAELRPYGPNGMNVCFPCAMKDEKEAIRQFNKRVRNCERVFQVTKH